MTRIHPGSKQHSYTVNGTWARANGDIGAGGLRGRSPPDREDAKARAPVEEASGGSPVRGRLVERLRQLAGTVLGTFPGRVFRKYLEDNGPTQAVSIAWNLLQSLFPVALILAAILGLVLSRVGVGSVAIYEMVVRLVPEPAGQAQILETLERMQTKTGLFAVLGIIGFMWMASLLFGAMEQAFDVIYHVPLRDFFRQKLMAVALMVVFAGLTGLAIITSAMLPVLERLPGLPLSLGANGVVRLVAQFVIGAVCGFVLFFIVYYVVPNRRQQLRQVWPGALFAGVSFQVLTYMFPIYLHVAGQGMDQYGKTFGLFFILMFFFFLMASITVFGAEINAVLYPVPIPQPERAQALSPATTGANRPQPEIAARRARRRAVEREKARGER